MISAAEKDLVRRAQEGDKEAFANLVILHQKFAYNVALRAVNNTQDAEDIVQDAFVKAWKSLGGFRADALFRTWLYRIVMNSCYSHLPKLRQDIESLEAENGGYQIPESNPDFDPAGRLEGKEVINFLQDQIQTLPGQYQILLLLRHQQECSYAEIADIMDLPLGTVKTGIHRARERLKEAVTLYQEEWVQL